MSTNWRISSFNGALLAAYFIPTWTILSFKITVLPIRSFFERPNVSVAFFAVFLMLLTSPRIRRSGGCDEALALALGLGSLICFAMMVMASLVHEPEAMRLHATELMMLLGTAIVMLVERPLERQAAQGAETLALEEPELLHNH